MPAPQPLRDGSTILTGGMQGGFHPSLLSPAEYSRGINLTCRGGFLHTRPGWTELVPSLTPLRPFQGAHRWSANGQENIAMVFNGTLFVYNLTTLSTWSYVGIAIPGRQVFFQQVDRYLVVSDGVQLAVVAPGNVILYNTVVPEAIKLLPGTVMHYAHSRLHYVPTTVGTEPSYGRYFVSGDICLPNDPTNVFKFEEATYLNGGGAFGLPDELGAIRGMGSLRNSAQGTGVGALIVFAEGGAAAFDVARPRQGIRDGAAPGTGNLIVAGWNDQPIGQILYYGAGMDSPWSVVSYNNDLVYRGYDGIRFLQYTASQATSGLSSGSLSNTPQSFEVDPWIANEAEGALPWVSAAFANNRLHMTAMATHDAYGATFFRGVITLDSAIAQTMKTRVPPAYDGLWTGLPVGKILSIPYKGKPTLFVVTTDARIFYLDEAAYTDHGSTPIQSQLETRAYFSDPQVSQVPKSLEYVELSLSGLRHNTTVEAYFRPDGHPLWTLMNTTRTVTVPSGGYPQERQQMRFFVPDDSGTNTDRPGLNSRSLRNGLTFQVRLVITGYATIERVDVVATAREASSPEVLTDEPADKVRTITEGLYGIAANDFSYSVP